MAHKKKASFEDCVEIIDTEILKRRGKWNLTALAWIDFEDVAQIIRIHIYKKWNLYDSDKPLLPWINRIISNQIKNLIRNNYGNFSRPCLKCAAAEGEDLCFIYTKQCNECPLYAHWEKNKKQAHDTKLALPLENHMREVTSQHQDCTDVERAAEKLHTKMETILKPIEWKVYKTLYIDFKSEEFLAKEMGYTTSEKNRSPGYKQIKNLKKSIMLKVKKVLASDDVDIF